MFLHKIARLREQLIHLASWCDNLKCEHVCLQIQRHPKCENFLQAIALTKNSPWDSTPLQTCNLKMLVKIKAFGYTLMSKFLAWATLTYKQMLINVNRKLRASLLILHTSDYISGSPETKSVYWFKHHRLINVQ